MQTLREIHDFFHTFAPESLSESWDNDGVMLCRDLDTPVKKAVVSLEISKGVIDYARQTGADLIITHHPFLFKPMKSVQGEVYRTLYSLMEKDITVLSYHTRLDSAEGGVNDVLAALLGLKNIAPFGGEAGNLGRFGELQAALSAAEFASLVKEKLGCGTIRASFPENAIIQRVGVIGGGGKDYFRDAAAVGCDAYLTADLSHNTFLDAAALGLSIFDAGHYYTENVVVAELCKRLAERFCDLSITPYDVKSPYVNL